MKSDTALLKQKLRMNTRAARSALSNEELEVAKRGLTKQLQQLVHDEQATTITCFMPVRGEPDTTEFIAWAQSSGLEVLLPVSQPDGLLDWVLPDGAEFVAGAFGVREPVGTHLGPLGAERADLMLIPAAAVDVTGHRLGWGRGYFDRNLASLTKKPRVFAVVHETEIIDRVPTEPHDQPVDGVVTPERTRTFS